MERRKFRPCRFACLLLLSAVTCLTLGFIVGKFVFDTGDIPVPSSNVFSISTSRKEGSINAKGFSSHCKDTCKFAKNGVCNEGRSRVMNTSSGLRQLSFQLVTCDLGTDCTDCGAWMTSSKHPTWLQKGGKEGPVSLLTNRKIEIRVKAAAIQMPGVNRFEFAYTDPKKDVDVSNHFDASGMVERGITKVFYNIFKGRCVQSDGSKALFVDVGGNFGWFSILAASMGCRVIVFEPVPHFRAFLEYNVLRNDLQHLVDIVGSVVSHMTGGPELKLVVPSNGIWGTAGIDGLNIDQSIRSNNEEIHVKSVTLDEVVSEDVLLLKVDVEGWEWSVMRGAEKLLQKYNVENVVMEYSPGVGERSQRYNDMLSTIKMLMDLVEGGFRIGHITEHNMFDPLESPLSKYEEVTARNLKYDLRDLQLYKNHQLGCPPPVQSPDYPCNGVPEDLSPRSFRSVIGHNTNVWAAKNSSTLLKLEGVVGMLGLEEPAETYIATKIPNHGMGKRHCMGIEPKFQVHHRCRCTDEVICGETERTVVQMAEEGKISSNYVIREL
jgi:FkbM family methyltransferase